jgi:hypothetical protein
VAADIAIAVLLGLYECRDNTDQDMRAGSRIVHLRRRRDRPREYPFDRGKELRAAVHTATGGPAAVAANTPILERETLMKNSSCDTP